MNAAIHALDAGQLHYRAGGAGPPVVLLHGFSLDQRMWDEQAAALARDFFVIRYDLRGYGRSSLPGSAPYSHADDLQSLLSSLDALPAHVVGLSAGGRHALQFALCHPKSLRSLTLVDSALDGHEWSPQWRAHWQAIDRAAKSRDLNGARRLWLEHPLFVPAREQPIVAARLSEMVGDYSGWHWVNADPGLAPTPPAIHRLDTIRVPSLIVVGERDLPDFRRIANTLGAGIPGAASAVIAGAGHMANMEAPAKFNALLAEFLRS